MGLTVEFFFFLLNTLNETVLWQKLMKSEKLFEFSRTYILATLSFQNSTGFIFSIASCNKPHPGAGLHKICIAMLRPPSHCNSEMVFDNCFTVALCRNGKRKKLRDTFSCDRGTEFIYIHNGFPFTTRHSSQHESLAHCIHKDAPAPFFNALACHSKVFNRQGIASPPSILK